MDHDPLGHIGNSDEAEARLKFMREFSKHIAAVAKKAEARLHAQKAAAHVAS
jgi:hypothetical protein